MFSSVQDGVWQWWGNTFSQGGKAFKDEKKIVIKTVLSTQYPKEGSKQRLKECKN